MGNLLQDFSELLCEMEDWALHSASFNLCQLFMPLLEKYNEIILCSKSSIQFHVHNEKYSFLVKKKRKEMKWLPAYFIV